MVLTPLLIVPRGFLTKLTEDFPKLLISWPKLKNSRNPVSGLIVPEPPCLLSSLASSSLICANMVSPIRPFPANMRVASAIPPAANCIGGSGIACSGAACMRWRLASNKTIPKVAINSGSYSGGKTLSSTMPACTNWDTALAYSSSWSCMYCTI